MAIAPTAPGSAAISPTGKVPDSAVAPIAQAAKITQPGGGGAPVAASRPPFQIEASREKAVWLKLLGYGTYGSGKTYLMGTAADIPKMRDVLLLSAETGDLTLDPNDADHEFQWIDTVRVHDYSTAARVYDYLKLHCALRDIDTEEATARLRGLQTQLLGPSKDSDRLRRYRTIIIDSAAEIEAYCMAQLLGIDQNVKLDDETASREWSHFNKQMEMMTRFFRGFRNLPMHVLFTCPDTFREDETKRAHYMPMMSGQLRKQIQGFMDMVGYLQVGTSDQGIPPRRLGVQPGNRFEAKCRFSRFKGAYFDDPSMGKILHAVGLLEEADLPEKLRKATAPAKP